MQLINKLSTLCWIMSKEKVFFLNFIFLRMCWCWPFYWCEKARSTLCLMENCINFSVLFSFLYFALFRSRSFVPRKIIPFHCLRVYKAQICIETNEPKKKTKFLFRLLFEHEARRIKWNKKTWRKKREKILSLVWRRWQHVQQHCFQKCSCSKWIPKYFIVYLFV